MDLFAKKELVRSRKYGVLGYVFRNTLELRLWGKLQLQEDVATSLEASMLAFLCEGTAAELNW